MNKFICSACGSKMQVGDWHEKAWYCFWCIDKVKKSKPYEPPPVPLSFTAKELKHKQVIKIEEIPCDGKL